MQIIFNAGNTIRKDMIKYMTTSLICIVFLFIHNLTLHSQKVSSSPYSMFGIGDIVPDGFGSSRAMGGTGIALSSNLTLNNINPASYHAIDSLLFLLETGIDGRKSSFSDGIQKQTNNTINFSYFTLGFRITPWWANSIGIAPFSSVGNNISTVKTIEGSTNQYNVNLEGTGGLTQYYWGSSFKLFKELYAGINFAYLLGSVKQTESLTSLVEQTSPTADYFKGTLITQNKATYSKIHINYGLQYSFKINKDIKATVGGIFSTKEKMRQRNDIAILSNSNSDTLDHISNTQQSFSLPLSYGLGIALRYNDNVLLTADYKFYQWSKTQSLQDAVRFVNSEVYGVGAEILPSTSFRAFYIAKIKYRVGAYMNNNYLMVNGKQIRDKGLSLGIGVPISNRFRVYLTYQYGNKGAKGLINENYHTLMLNVSFSDLWFIKPKFD
jgi:hypothetical protein